MDLTLCKVNFARKDVMRKKTVWCVLLLIFFSGDDGTASADDKSDNVVLTIKARLDKSAIINETFVTNEHDSSIVAQFELQSGLICYIVYDFLNAIKIFKVDVLGETELGQKQYQSICFLTKLNPNDIIPTDAMAKLRQKSSASIQEANDVLQSLNLDTDVELSNIASSQNLLGERFHRYCSGRESIIHVKELELFSLARGNPDTLKILKEHVHKSASIDSLSKCLPTTISSSKNQPCLCKIPFTIAWYPCVVKYCPAKKSTGNSGTTRCGIKSCKITYNLGFVANHPLSCHWGVT